MANTPVSICSNALIGLGDDPITALTDNTNRARHCNRLYHPTRQAVLREVNWNDSIKRQQLAQLVDEPVYEWAYQYSLPSDYIKMVRTSLDEHDHKYKIEARKLLTNESEVYITYVYDNEDVASYDSLHVDAFTARLKFELAAAVTGKQSHKDSAWGEWQAKRAEAKVADGQEDFQEEQTVSILNDVRY